MIKPIPVPRADIIAGEPWRPCLQVGYFVEQVRESGGEAELSPDALLFADLWKYLGEVTNGGHAQYHENEEDCVLRLHALRELLRRIGLPGHAELLNKLEHIIIENEDDIFELWAGGDDMMAKEIFYGVDDQFAELEVSEGRLQDHLWNWLVQQPWIVPEDDQR
ncbi:DUF4375 domain-containing protein [Sphingomonas naphthae]|uniref:DUF4375 domain-containing protein n=1 Tax=Sphingomonas naphthae TaxID=1813468 RepID=A0ABY7THH8_9SPHN|nr:DUF4375 domain-containing protein [Sphingomonas naphthae]WCT72676.1 DUF4375 domain-containing protein [Sphingomonas naphthae]